MKRRLAWILLASTVLTFTGCGTANEDKKEETQVSENLEQSCADVLKEIYENATTGEEDDFFNYAREYENVEITEENEEYILGTTEIDFTDSVYSAPMMSSIAYQCVLLRVSEEQDIDEAKKLLEENANPRKWVCVEAESVVVENVGDMILFIMSDSNVSDAVKEQFLAMKK